MNRQLPRWLPPSLVVLALLATAAPIFVLGGSVTPNATQPPLTFPIAQPTGCDTCHGGYLPGPWLGSMMANSARDPLFWAALDVANNDIPGVGGFCLRCHVPQGWLMGRAEPSGPDPGVDGCRMLGPIDGGANDFEGVSCEFCHRMMVNPSPPPGEQGSYIGNAAYWIDDVPCTTPGGDGATPCRRGPYGDYPPNGTAGAPPHRWAQSDYHRSSDFCGTCHNVTSPAQTLVDNKGVDTTIPYPIERTYSEWTQSAFADEKDPGAATCQGCHMPTPLTSPTYACSFQENNRFLDGGWHEFVGANAWVPSVLKGEYPGLDRGDAYDATVASALDLLQNYTAELDLTVLPTIGAGATSLDASVRVTNLAGHKLPTGYTEGRRMWIHLEVRDGNGDLVFESGAYNPTTGELTRDAQVKVYETERGIWNRNNTNECDVVDENGDHIFHFVLNDCIKLDNRIPPRGFTPNAETVPVGYSYAEVSPGVLQHWDDTEYTIPIPPGTSGPLSVTATLRHQVAPKEYVEFLRDQAVDNTFADDCIERASGTPMTQSRGEYLYALWTAYGRSAPVDMVEGASEVAIVIFADGFESGNTSAWSAAVP